MDYIKLKLTLPPSVNGLYAGMTRRYKAPKYKQWINIAQMELLTQDRGKIIGDAWLEVRYIFHMPIYNLDETKKKKDVFNFEKALSDLLEKEIDGFEDHKIKKAYVEKIHSEERYVIISIRELDAKTH